MDLGVEDSLRVEAGGRGRAGYGVRHGGRIPGSRKQEFKGGRGDLFLKSGIKYITRQAGNTANAKQEHFVLFFVPSQSAPKEPQASEG